MCVHSLCEQPFGLWLRHFLDSLGLLGAPGGPGDKDRVSSDLKDELSGNVNKRGVSPPSHLPLVHPKSEKDKQAVILF